MSKKMAPWIFIVLVASFFASSRDASDPEALYGFLEPHLMPSIGT